jgi:hypothetical protein
MHLYAILYHFLRTNLLTQCQVPVAIFLPVFGFPENQYQTESKRYETF